MNGRTDKNARIDVVLDTDAYNEIDDQFAIAYLCRSEDRLRPVAFYAAPFSNEKSDGPADGMRKSYAEIGRVLSLCGGESANTPVFYGSEGYLPDEKTPILSAAATDLCRRAAAYSPERPLYVVAIGAITNIASALLMSPQIAENLVVVWLGGNARHIGDNREFNLLQDIAAARVVMASRARFVQLPCLGTVSEFRTSGPELERWLVGKNPLADYLAQNVIRAAEAYAAGKPWTRVIWDVTAVAWLLNDGGRFMRSEKKPVCLPGYDHRYEAALPDKSMDYVYFIRRDELMEDLFRKLLR